VPFAHEAGERLAQPGRPVTHPDAHRQRAAAPRELGLQGARLGLGEGGDRRAPAEQLVVLRHRLEARLRHRPAREHAAQKRPNVSALVRAAERDDQQARRAHR
jgi:hypothetical protein